MPELNNVQTYEKIEGTNFKPVIERFSKVLINIGLWNSEIKEAFETFDWIVEDNGFVYGTTSYLQAIPSSFSDIKIRPLVTGYTSEIDPSFDGNWIACDLLIESSEILTYNSKYKLGVFELVKALVQEMQKEFTQNGVYFTDEGQDGQDFFALIENNKSKLWQFEYAVLPLSFKELYADVPANYLVKTKEGLIEALRVAVWNENVVELFEQI